MYSLTIPRIAVPADGHRDPVRQLKTVRRPPIYPNGAQAISPAAPSPPFRCPHAVHRWIRAYQYRWEVDSQVLIARQRPVKRYNRRPGPPEPVLRQPVGRTLLPRVRPRGLHERSVRQRQGVRSRIRHRSADYGATWSCPSVVDLGHAPIEDPLYSPYGKMTELPDGAILMPTHAASRTERRRSDSLVLRSRDGGRTWVTAPSWRRASTRTALLHLASGRLIAMMRSADGDLWQTESDDLAIRGARPRRINAADPAPR